MSKLTIDDIVDASNVSRATIYRLFPGGREVLLEALRVREFNRVFELIAGSVAEANNLEDAIAFGVATATHELHTDPATITIMELEPEVLVEQLAFDGLTRILLIAQAALGPGIRAFASPEVAAPLLELVTRLTISYFFAPDPSMDLTDRDQARTYFAPIVRGFVASTDTSSPAIDTEP